MQHWKSVLSTMCINVEYIVDHCWIACTSLWTTLQVSVHNVTISVHYTDRSVFIALLNQCTSRWFPVDSTLIRQCPSRCFEVPLLPTVIPSNHLPIQMKATGTQSEVILEYIPTYYTCHTTPIMHLDIRKALNHGVIWCPPSTSPF